MEKRKITLTVIVAAVLLVALIGGTYAYWTANTESKNSVQATIQTGTLSLILDDVDGITEEDKIDANHTEIVKYFSLTNSGVGDVYANLIWKGLLNTFVRDDLVYELEEVQSDKSSFTNKRMVVTETVVPKTSTNENVSLANGILVKTGTVSGNTVTPNVQYYKLTVKYKYSDTENQNDDLNKVLVSGFDLGEGVQQKVRLTLNVGDGATISSNTADVTYTGTYEDLPTPTKEGYKFGGWYTDSAFTNRVLSTSMVSTTNSQELYAKWDEKATKLVDVNENDITDLSTIAQGARLKIGTEYFRYLRTTDTGKLRFLAEHNLKISGTASSSTAIASDALQDPNDSGIRNAVKYGLNNNYSQSYVKSYINNYRNTINGILENNNSIIVEISSLSEITSLGWDCHYSSDGGRCNNMPSWAGNSSYWLINTYVSDMVWCIITPNHIAHGSYYNIDTGGVRPVIEIDPSLLQ